MELHSPCSNQLRVIDYMRDDLYVFNVLWRLLCGLTPMSNAHVNWNMLLLSLATQPSILI